MTRPQLVALRAVAPHHKTPVGNTRVCRSEASAARARTGVEIAHEQLPAHSTDVGFPTSASHAYLAMPYGACCGLQMVRLLVWAGANVNACNTTGNMHPALAQALVPSKQEEEDAQILDILIGEDGLCSAMIALASNNT